MEAFQRPDILFIPETLCISVGFSFSVQGTKELDLWTKYLHSGKCQDIKLTLTIEVIKQPHAFLFFFFFFFGRVLCVLFFGLLFCCFFFFCTVFCSLGFVWFVVVVCFLRFFLSVHMACGNS